MESAPPPPPGFVSHVQRFFGAKQQTDRRRIPIELRRFAGPAAFHHRMSPVRIAHLTDLHFGRVTPLQAQIDAVDLTNEQRPDLVMLTGDFVCHSQLYLDQLTHVLSKLDAPTFGVLGNHDYWSGSEEVVWALRRAGIEVLSNQHTTIEVRHERIQVVGLDDAYTDHADVVRATKGLRRDLPSVALSHIAEEADHLWYRGVPMVLSGHTHAGQVTLAGLHEWTLGRLAGHKYVHGLYGTRDRNGGQGRGAVYVGAGIGASVVPFRLGERGQREVAMFELGLAPDHVDEHHEEQSALPGRPPSDKTKYKRAAKVVSRKLKREKRRGSQ